MMRIFNCDEKKNCNNNLQNSFTNTKENIEMNKEFI